MSATSSPLQRRARRPRQPRARDIHSQVISAPGHRGRADERHGDHDVDLHLVGAVDGPADDVAADDVREVENDREDEGEREHALEEPDDGAQFAPLH